MDDPNLSPPEPKSGLTQLLKRISDTEIIRRTRRFSPVLIRGSLWVGIAMLTELRSSVAKLAEKGNISTLDWSDSIVGAVLAGLIAWRLFLDQSMSRFHDQNGSKGPI